MPDERRGSSDKSRELNYLHVRLSGMEGDVELTPGYREWRKKTTEENDRVEATKATHANKISKQLGAKATEQE